MAAEVLMEKVDQYFREHGYPYDYAAEARRIFEEAKQKRNDSRRMQKRPVNLVGALVYLTFKNFDNYRTQGDLAQELGTTETSIRKSIKYLQGAEEPQPRDWTNRKYDASFVERHRKDINYILSKFRNKIFTGGQLSQYAINAYFISRIISKRILLPSVLETFLSAGLIDRGSRGEKTVYRISKEMKKHLQ